MPRKTQRLKMCFGLVLCTLTIVIIGTTNQQVRVGGEPPSQKAVVQAKDKQDLKREEFKICSVSAQVAHGVS